MDFEKLAKGASEDFIKDVKREGQKDEDKKIAYVFVPGRLKYQYSMLCALMMAAQPSPQGKVDIVEAMWNVALQVMCIHLNFTMNLDKTVGSKSRLCKDLEISDDSSDDEVIEAYAGMIASRTYRTIKKYINHTEILEESIHAGSRNGFIGLKTIVHDLSCKILRGILPDTIEKPTQ